MRTINDLKEKKWRTSHVKDAYGNRHKERREYIAPRLVRAVQPGPRLGHAIVDWITFQVLFYVLGLLLGIVSSLLSPTEPASFLVVSSLQGIIILLIVPFLYVFMEYKWQKTPGKFLTKTVVINEFAERPDIGTLILRTLIRVVPFEIFSCLGDKHKRSIGWHDRWSKTWVVTEEERDKLKELLQQEDPKLEL